MADDNTGWPKPIDAFLAEAERHLARGDIVLCRGSSLFSRLIRWATRSRFSHAALIFLVPHRDDGFDNTFVIEASTGGVDLTDLKHYAIERAKDYQVAIRRLERDWFTEDIQRLVRGRMLDFIKADYDYATVWTLARHAIRRIVFGIRVRTQGLERTMRTMRAQRELAPAQFICSGFVQWGFFSTLQTLVKEGKLTSAQFEQVLFKRGLTPDSDTSAVISTTPEDIAQTDKLVWRFAIKDGLVYRVSTAAEVDAIIAA